MRPLRKTVGMALYLLGLALAAALACLVLFRPQWFDARVTLFFCMGYFLVAVLAGYVYICREDSLATKGRAAKGSVWLLFLVYVILLVAILFAETYREEAASMGLRQYAGSHINLTPFASIRRYFPEAFQPGNTAATLNLVGNLLLFVPMGVFLPALMKWQRHTVAFLLTMLAMLACVELGQLYLQVGYCDVDDILLNMTGALAAYLTTKLRIVKKLGARVYLWEARAY